MVEKIKNPKKGPKGALPSKALVYVSKEYPAWQVKMRNTLTDLFKSLGRAPEKSEYIKSFQSDATLKKDMKFVMGAAAYHVKLAEQKGLEVLSTNIPFDEVEVIKSNMEYVSKEIDQVPLEIVIVTPELIKSLPKGNHLKAAQTALPLSPGTVVDK